MSVPAGTLTPAAGRAEGASRPSTADAFTTSDLLLLLWRRRSPAQVIVLGERAALDRLLARTDLD